MNLYGNFGKRTLDLIASLSLLLIFSPLLIPTSIILAIANKGKVFFLQKRPGYKGELFTIYKFKTMTDAVDPDGNLLPDEERHTFIGDIVRKLSLDEIVQLINVVKGEMSLIGPRPLLIEYLPYYSEHQMRRHDCLPGITGLAQVKGRNALSWERRFRYDVFYSDHISFWFDFKIALWTIKTIFMADDIYSDKTVEEMKFRGTHHQTGSTK